MPLPDHPRLLLAARPTPGLRTAADLRAAIADGHCRQLWEALLAKAEADRHRPPYTPFDDCAHRDPDDRRLGIRDYTIVDAAATRLERAALAALLTGERVHVDDLLRQAACLFDASAWPVWCDQAHATAHNCDLRTGQFLRALGYALDWAWHGLTDDERRWLIAGLDRCGLQPYRHALASQAWWAVADHPNNWQTCIVGGAGIAAMALAGEIADAEELLAFANRKMDRYLDQLGPEGEFNECVGYSGSMHYPIEYAATCRTFSGGGDTRLGGHPFTDFCLGYFYFTLPPGKVFAHGDCKPGAPPMPTVYPAVAAAARDGLLQHAYLRDAAGGERTRRNEALELLHVDPTVAPIGPAERGLPLGRAWRAHSACWISRSSWDPLAPACVVVGKAGHGSEGHGHHDAGEVCIEAEGQSLLVDIGCPKYPADYFGPNRYRYYFAAARAHNVVTVADREMAVGEEHAATVLDARFDDCLGAVWAADLTPLYPGAARVRRTVIHLLPGVVAVLDEVATGGSAERIALRWHTADRAAPDADGAFYVVNGSARLSARVVALDGGTLSYRRGEHEHVAGFDRDRRGLPLPANRESFVEATLTASRARLLSLFAVGTDAAWRETADGWRIALADGEARVIVDSNGLRVTHGDRSLRSPIG